MVCTLSGYIPIGSSTVAAGNYLSVQVNSLKTPFNTSNNFSAAPGATYAFHGTATQGDSITNPFMGYSTMGAMYWNYKALHYKLTAKTVASNNGDIFTAVLFPVGSNEEIPSTSAGSTNLHVLAAQPGAAVRVCTPNRPQTLVVEQDVSELLGLTKTEWLGISPNQLGAAASYSGYCGFFLQQMNGSNNVAAIPVDLILEVTFLFNDIIQPVS
jgi:hypothetical protein